LIRTLPDSARCFLIKHGNDSVVARLNLSGMPDLLTVLSGREASVRRLDEIRAEVGDDPAAWLPRLVASV
jgi:type IV secretion system protein VirB4